MHSKRSSHSRHHYYDSSSSRKRSREIVTPAQQCDLKRPRCDPPKSEEEQRAERLKRREAILAKYKTAEKSQETPKKQKEEEEEEFGQISKSPTKGQSSPSTSVELPQEQKETKIFDMFGDETPVPVVVPTDLMPAVANVDRQEQEDADSYFCPRVGDILGGRYRVLSSLGKGVFSTVVKALDLETNLEVAIKVLRNNEAMRRSGNSEIELLKKLNETDPEKNCSVRILSHFMEDAFLCIVLEPLAMNLRELLKKEGKGSGFALDAVKLYAYKLFVALWYLKKLSIIHADIKVDNILVDATHSQIKLADFGSASYVNENTPTPYLVSMWYRAPEVILGHRYDFAVDMFSVGVCLYELYTGKILFPGTSNNSMLCLFQEAKGPFSKKVLRKGLFTSKHFDDRLQFLQSDEGVSFARVRTFGSQPVRDLKAEILACRGDSDSIEQVNLFYDLVDKCLHLDPMKRITPTEAIKHPFFSTAAQSAASQ